MTWVSVSSTKHVVGSPSAERFIAIIAEIHEQRTSWKSAGGGCIGHDFMLGRAPPELFHAILCASSCSR